MTLKVKSYKSATKKHLRWRVWFPKPDGRGRACRYFKTKDEAIAFVDEKSSGLASVGREAAGINPKIQLAAKRCLERLQPYGKSLDDATDHYIRHLEACAVSLPVETLVEQFLEQKELDQMSPRYLEDLQSRLGKLVNFFRPTVTENITTQDLDRWLRALKVGPQSRNHYRQSAHVFFEYCHKRGYSRANPAAALEHAKVVRGVPGIFTPTQLTVLLNTAQDPDIRAWVALGAFAGLRPAEIERLGWEHFRWDSGLIDLTAATTKTAQRRLVHIEPALKTWLKPIQGIRGRIIQPNWLKRMAAYKEVLKNPEQDKGTKRPEHEPVTWVHDGLRHSFASYHMAMHQDAARTSAILGHSDSQMLFRHYREVVTPESAISWFATLPVAAKNIVSLNESVAAISI